MTRVVNTLALVHNVGCALVGEYASLDFNTQTPQEPARQNTLGGALGEAAFMIGLERNSDVVWGASYAPLLLNVNNPAWLPDLIWFDANNIARTPNYWVQQMFSANRGDVILPVQADESAGLYASAALRRSDGSVVIKAVNNALSANEATIRLTGLDSIEALVCATVLTSANRTDGNSLSAPDQGAPRQRVLRGVSNQFDFTFPASSVAVIEVLPERRARARTDRDEGHSGWGGQCPPEHRARPVLAKGLSADVSH